ncbi:MAG: DUF655 domain-containing protein [Candidatus Hodarchaeales archaeon]
MRDKKTPYQTSRQPYKRSVPVKREDRQRESEFEGIILDYYEDVSRKGDRRAYIAFLLGCKKFSLLKGTALKPLNVKPGDKIKIRSNMATTKRIAFKDLSTSLQEKLGDFIEIAIQSDEKRFVDFFNNARPITTRLHSLKLLPGIGNKRMWNLLESRKRKEFESFEDLKERGSLSDPIDMLTKRILQEIQSGAEEKYKLFHK